MTRIKLKQFCFDCRIHALEEQLREVDYRSVEQMAEEKKRHEDLVARMEREKQLQREHDSIKYGWHIKLRSSWTPLESWSFSCRLHSVERDLKSSLSEVTTLRSQNDRLKFEKSQCDQELFESQRTMLQTQLELSKVQEINRREYGSMMEERKVNQHIVDELNKEVSSREVVGIIIFCIFCQRQRIAAREPQVVQVVDTLACRLCRLFHPSIPVIVVAPGHSWSARWNTQPQGREQKAAGKKTGMRHFWTLLSNCPYIIVPFERSPTTASRPSSWVEVSSRAKKCWARRGKRERR